MLRNVTKVRTKVPISTKVQYVNPRRQQCLAFLLILTIASFVLLRRNESAVVIFILAEVQIKNMFNPCTFNSRVVVDAQAFSSTYVFHKECAGFATRAGCSVEEMVLFPLLSLSPISRVFNPCKSILLQKNTGRTTIQERTIKSVVSQELASDEDYADAFRLMLTGLSNMCFQRSSADFRRIISREEVGLLWSLHPEKYWEDHVLPELQEEVTIIDVGANVGQFAIPNAEAGHNVLSFEPNPDTCKLLQSIATKKKLRRKVSLVELFHLND